MAISPVTKYHLRGKDFYVELHATSEIVISESSDVSEHPTVGGATISDNIVKKQTEIRLTGIITRTFSGKFDTLETPDKIVEQFREFMNGTQIGSLYIDAYTDPSREVSVDYYPNVVVTSFSRRRDKKLSNAWQVSLTLKQLIIPQQLTRGEVQVVVDRAAAFRQDFKDQGSPKATNSDSSVNSTFDVKRGVTRAMVNALF